MLVKNKSTETSAENCQWLEGKKSAESSQLEIGLAFNLLQVLLLV